MRIYSLIVGIFLLIGCEATPVNNAAMIKTKLKLDERATTPIQVPVAYYVGKKVPDDKVNFFGKMEEAAELITSEMFVSSENLTSESEFIYLIQLHPTSDWDYVWGGWESDIEINILDRAGNKLMSRTIQKKAAASGGLYDFNAVYNAFASALKDAMIEFININIDEILLAQNNHKNGVKLEDSKSIKDLFTNLEATNSGSGFFIDNKGTSVTAAHVVNECIFVEVNHKGNTYDADIIASSQLLDLAVVKIDYANSKSIAIEPEPSVQLGKQVFVTGYPLSGILAEYPSLTVGNISSRGGLKGAKGYFQFSAPIQPGNSGGAISDYKGNLMGVVSSSLNQSMMLKQSGTTSQNVNFGVSTQLLKQFLNKHNIAFEEKTSSANFESSSANAVEYSNQILCYK